MKRLAFWIVLGVMVVHVAGRHRHADRNGRPASRPRHAVTLASFDAAPTPSAFDLDDPPTPPAPPPTPPPAKPARKVRARPAPPAPPAKLEASAEPKRQPDWFPAGLGEDEARLGKPDAKGVRILVGQLSSTEAKARADLRQMVDREVGTWLAGDVPAGWNPPVRIVNAMIGETYVQPVAESLGDVSKDLDEIYTLHRAGARVDFSASKKAQFLEAHHRQLVRERMFKGGGVLGFVLVALAVLAGYIRTDEATKGYYTNRLRMLAAAGVGGAGVVIYQMLV